MLRQGALRSFGFILLVGILIAGIVHLMSLRMEHGDVYPPYSSFRSDPLGSKVLYEALREVPALETERNFRDIARLRPTEPITFFLAGVSTAAIWEPGELGEFSSLIRSGSRAVITFIPSKSHFEKESTPKPELKKDGPKQTSSEKRYEEAKARAKKEAAESEKKEGGESPEGGGTDGKGPESPSKDEAKSKDEGYEFFSQVASKWGFSFEHLAIGKNGDDKAEVSESAGELKGAAPVSWLSPLYFGTLSPAWRVIYTFRGKPVIIERQMGKGSVVLASDSYFISNEAMLKDRRPRLLSWLIGPSRVVFDEAHLGVHEETGMMQLAKKHGLRGFMAVLALVALLFAWKSVSAFIPPYETSTQKEEVILGRGSEEGLISLLRRAVPPGKLFEKCVAEWRINFERTPKLAARMDETLPLVKGKAPAAAYRQIASALQNPAQPLKAEGGISKNI